MNNAKDIEIEGAQRFEPLNADTVQAVAVDLQQYDSADKSIIVSTILLQTHSGTSREYSTDLHRYIEASEGEGSSDLSDPGARLEKWT